MKRAPRLIVTDEYESKFWGGGNSLHVTEQMRGPVENDVQLMRGPVENDVQLMRGHFPSQKMLLAKFILSRCRVNLLLVL